MTYLGPIAVAAVLLAGPCFAEQADTSQARLPTTATITMAAPPSQGDVPPTPRHTGVKALFRDLGTDFKQLPSKETLYWALGGGGLALAIHPADSYVQEHMQGNRLADDFFKPGQVIGIVVPWAGSVATYAWGRLKDQPRVSHVGMDLIESQVMATTITQGLKLATRRERPDGSGKTSFPSGHASATFAFATALERHLGWRYATAAYIGASYVAVSRLPANRHWLSDVVFGAAVGVISGRTVTHTERMPYPVSISPLPGGVVVTYRPPGFNHRR